MKIEDPGADTLQAATQGDLAAIDRLLLTLQGGVYNLAVRMLGQREDAADATQEILLKVVTHLGSYRGEAAFTTWVHQIARHHLLSAATRARESPAVSLEAMAERLGQGLAYATALGEPDGQSLTPEDKAEARQVAVSCTQNMLMALDREQRLVYVLDAVFALPSKEAAQVIGIQADAYRQRLARVRARLDGFTASTCGLRNADAACRCDKQLPALRHAAPAGAVKAAPLLQHRAEREAAEKQLDALLQMSDAAALFRAHPAYRVPASLHAAIRAVLGAGGYLPEPGGLQ